MRKAAALRRLPVCLDRVDLVIAVVDALVVMHFVEDEVLEFRTEIGSVADARAGEIGLRFPGDIARIPARAAKARRSLLAQPRLLKSASSRFLPVHKADLERQQRADSGPSPGDPSRRANRPEAEVPTCLPNRHRDAKQLVRAAMEFALFDLETPHRVRKRRSFTKTRRRR
jgi:hypothetical protein